MTTKSCSDKAGNKSRGNSKKLRDNIHKAGKREPDFPNVAHHIVGGNGKGSAKRREILDNLEPDSLDINAADNGVFLRTTDEGTGTKHSGRHTNDYDK